MLGFIWASEVLDAEACCAVEALLALRLEVFEVVLAAADDEGGAAPLAVGWEVGAARLVEEELLLLLLLATELLLDLRVEPTSFRKRDIDVLLMLRVET